MINKRVAVAIEILYLLMFNINLISC
jgi:hypothetical protein